METQAGLEEMSGYKAEECTGPGMFTGLTLTIVGLCTVSACYFGDWVLHILDKDGLNTLCLLLGFVNGYEAAATFQDLGSSRQYPNRSHTWNLEWQNPKYNFKTSS